MFIEPVVYVIVWKREAKKSAHKNTHTGRKWHVVLGGAWRLSRSRRNPEARKRTTGKKIETCQILKCESTRNWRESTLSVRFWNITTDIGLRMTARSKIHEKLSKASK